MDTRKLKTNLVIIIALVAIVGGYLFFFLSPRIFSADETNLVDTPLSEKINIDRDHSFTIETWDYCKEEKKMGVIIAFDSNAANPSEKYVYQIVSRNKAKDKKTLDYNVTYQSSRFATLVINNVPNDFLEMALSVGFVDKHIDESGTTPEGKEDITATFATAFTNKNTVGEIESIEKLNVVDLYIVKIQKENSDLNEKITELEKKNVEIKTQQQDILAAVAELRNSEVYVSEKEKEEIKGKISSYQQTYDSLESTLNSNIKLIKENQDVVNTNTEKIKELQAMTKGSDN